MAGVNCLPLEKHANLNHSLTGKYLEYKQIEQAVLVNDKLNPKEIFGNCNDPCWKIVTPKIINAAYFDSVIGNGRKTHYLLNNPQIVPNESKADIEDRDVGIHDYHDVKSFTMTFSEMKQLVLDNIIKNKDLIKPLTKDEMEAFEWNCQTYLKIER